MSKSKSESKFENAKNKRIGEVYSSNHGEVVIVDYKGSQEVTVLFKETGGTTTTNMGAIRKGIVKDRMKKTVCGFGLLGIGRHKSSDSNGRNTKAYTAWVGMIVRCYSGKYPSYKECTVCDEWSNFQCFAEWYESNHKEGFDLDKDIKSREQKVYSPDTCLFVSKTLNVKYAAFSTKAKAIAKEISSNGVIDYESALNLLMNSDSLMGIYIDRNQLSIIKNN